MLTLEERRARYAFMQDGFRRRSRNLLQIVNQLGGWDKAALRTGKSRAKLQQICNPDHPWHQTIGDKLARELEGILRLRVGALDEKPTGADFSTLNFPR